MIPASDPAAREAIGDNPLWGDAHPRLSVLTPFFRDDPTPLLRALSAEAAVVAGEVELVLLDDGGSDSELFARVEAAVQGIGMPARLIRLATNGGRSAGRNRLAAAARGRHLLFVDSDMLPDQPAFLRRWLALIGERDPSAAVGGFSLVQTRVAPRYALHAAMQGRAECASVQVRAGRPEKYVFTSNLLVRRDVLEHEPFDPAFVGWGWEDVEWGMRVSGRFGVLHVDNTASHLGLDTALDLIAKYEQSGPNYARVLARHPDVLRSYPSHRLARVLRRLPARGRLRAVLRKIALFEGAPLLMRVAALKTFRAAIYAEVVA